VRELEASREIVRQEQLRAMVNHLHDLGIDATLAGEATTDLLGKSTTEAVIQLSVQSIHRIRLASNDYGGYGIDSGSRFQYEIISDRSLSRELKEAIDAKTKPVKENKFLGLFGGKFVDIKWVGRDIADQLNRDAELSRQLLECAKCGGNVELQIKTKFPSVVEILGPQFFGPSPMLRAELRKDTDACYKIFEFEIYNRMAKHVRDVLDAS
jgi:hypothetical protein